MSILSVHCPHCKSVDFWGVDARNVLERILHLLFLPYRCSLCGRHFFLLRWRAPIAGSA